MPNLTGATNYFTKAAENSASMTLASSIAAGATTVPLTGSSTNYSDGDIVCFVIEPTSSTNKQVFTGKMLAGSVTNVVWTFGTNVPHSSGVPVVDYATATDWDLLTTGLQKEHNQDGTHSTSLLSKLYPVGSVYINAANASNPSTFFGFGTWVSFGTGQVLVGVDGGQTEFNTVGKTGGEKNHTLTQNEMPSHSHSDNGHTHAGGSGQQFLMNASGGAVGYGGGANGLSAISTTGAGYASITNTGGGAAHNNLQPYITVYMWQRTA